MEIRCCFARVLFLVVLVWQVYAKPPFPHIVLIIGDDVGWNDLGYHGSDVKTPAIDALATAGVRLDRMYVMPQCSPTRSSLMTGRYSMRFGLQHQVIIQTQAVGVPTNEKFLSEKLKSLNYSTHIVGKWHLGFYQPQYLPLSRGFDTHFGVYSADIDYYIHGLARESICNPVLSEKQCPRCFFGYDLWENNKRVALKKNILNVYSSYLWNRKALQAIRKHESNDKPFFLYFTPNNAHTPLVAEQYFVDKYCSHISNATRRTFCGSVAALDSLVENVTQALKDRGMWQDTLLIYVSDNGGEVYDRRLDPVKNSGRYSYGNNWPLKGGKFTVWEGGVRVPSFVYSEMLSQNVRGTINNGLFHISDIYPTIVEGVLRQSTSDSLPLDGFNAWDSISQGTPSPRTEVLINTDALDKFSGALIQGPWKLVVGNSSDGQLKTTNPPHVPTPDLEGKSPCMASFGEDNTIRLYNIVNDPSECMDVALMNPLITASMLQRYVQFTRQAEFPHFPFSDPNSNPDFYRGFWSPWQNNDGTPLNPDQFVKFSTCDLQGLVQTVQSNLAFISGTGQGYCPNEPGSKLVPTANRTDSF